MPSFQREGLKTYLLLWEAWNDVRGPEMRVAARRLHRARARVDGGGGRAFQEGLKAPSILDNRKLMDHMNENRHLQAENRLKKGLFKLYATFGENAR